AEILEILVADAEEHLHVVTNCLLSLQTNPSPEEINHLLRAMPTVKGAAAQVGLQRISRVAHRAEDLIGRLRDGALRPSAEIIDICLEAVDVLKQFLYRQWLDEAAMQAAVHALFTRIGRLAPEEHEEPLEVLSNERAEPPQVLETPAAEATVAEKAAAAEATLPPPVEVVATAEAEPPAEERSPLVKTGHAEALKD